MHTPSPISATNNISPPPYETTHESSALPTDALLPCLALSLSQSPKIPFLILKSSTSLSSAPALCLSSTLRLTSSGSSSPTFSHRSHRLCSSFAVPTSSP